MNSIPENMNKQLCFDDIIQHMSTILKSWLSFLNSNIFWILFYLVFFVLLLLTIKLWIDIIIALKSSKKYSLLKSMNDNDDDDGGEEEEESLVSFKNESSILIQDSREIKQEEI